MGIYATGKHSWSLCDRCGLTFRYLSIKNEEGTGFRVCAECDDGQYNLLTHPQNRIGEWFQKPEKIALRYPRADVAFTTVGTSVSVWLSLTPYGSWD